MAADDEARGSTLKGYCVEGNDTERAFWAASSDDKLPRSEAGLQIKKKKLDIGKWEAKMQGNKA